MNYIAEHFEEGEMFSVHEKGVLLERDVGLEKGKFILRKNERYYRLVDRIELILTKCAADPVKAKGTWFADLKNAIIKRNKLVHPREAHKVTVQDIERALAAIIDCVDTLHRCVFRKAFPYKKNSMDAGLNFD